MGVQVPEVSVSVGKKDVETAMGGKIGSVRVLLAMNGESSAVIEVRKVYDIKARRLAEKISDGVKPGSPVEIQMGYAGEKSKVFVGYLERIELTMGEGQAHTLSLYAFDVVHLMKENRFSRMIVQKSHSEVLQELMKSYSWLGISVDCQKTDAYEEPKYWYQNENDFDFMTRELLEHCPAERDFYVVAGTVYYKEPGSDPPVATIELGMGVLGFRAVSGYLKRDILIHGTSASYQRFSGKSKAAADYLAGSAGNGTESLVVTDGNSQKLLEGIAKNCAKRRKREAVYLEFELAGNPKLLSGAGVKVNKLDPIWDGTYRVQQAEHIFDEEGYRTHIKVEGC